MIDKKRSGVIIAAVGAVVSLLALICYKLFPKMKECCCGMGEKCCPPEKKKQGKK